MIVCITIKTLRDVRVNEFYESINEIMM
jgi:hypothetical protein